MANQYRVWWVPQVPMKAFLVDVGSVSEAKKLLNVLADYDTFQLENKIKPDYCNAGGLTIFLEGEWLDWCDDDDNSIDDLTMEDCRAYDSIVVTS